MTMTNWACEVPRVLERAYEACGDHDSLIDELERQLSSYAELIDPAATHRRLAGLYEEHQSDLDLAFQHRCQAARLEWTAADDMRSELVRLAKATDRWDDLEQTDREAFEAALDHEQRLRILTEMARVATDGEMPPIPPKPFCERYLTNRLGIPTHWKPSRVI